VTFRVGYSQNVMEGPSLSPGESVGASDGLLQEYLRNSSDDFFGEVSWSPIRDTRLTYEQQVDHIKLDSYFTLAPSSLQVQEANGARASLGNWDSLTAYGISNCNTASMGAGYTNATSYTILSPSQTPHPLPDGDFPLSKLDHQKYRDEWECALYQRKLEPGKLLREFPGP
jgi:hypothetical protein